MGNHWITTRVHLADVKAMLLAHDQIESVVRALRGTNWAGAQTAIAALAPVDLWIVDLFNRCEPSWQKYLQRANSKAPQNGSAEPAGEAASSPEGDAKESEPGE